MNISINNSPTFNNTNVGSVANATAKTEPITIELAVEVIRTSDADDDVKQSAEAAVVDMGEAAKEGNIEKFADALESTAVPQIGKGARVADCITVHGKVHKVKVTAISVVCANE